jgi:hypothetical protein
VIKEFADTNPMIVAPQRTVTLDIDPDEFYKDPSRHARRLYETF